jgi:tetratricopeptide (TPR) repeat protein
LRRFTDVCNAIDYAHSRGVLHRDIKPANIVVGRYGETLVVDWGLAKATGKSDPSAGERTLVPSSASGSSDTLPGSALGTPAYMSPEQAEGDLDRLSAQSDVYSLGATLYCLLTGKPPFGGDAVDVIRAVQRGDIRPPRQVDPSIDPALEAICLKAMALAPVDRYTTPRALADDLEKWAADEPVSAWREPVSRRARRWARRNRPAVTAATAALLAGSVGLGMVAAVQTRANTELRAANRREQTANAALADQKARVQERYGLALEAIKTFHTGVSEDFLVKEAQFKNLRDRLLTSASDFYGKLGALLARDSDPASRVELLRANFELAELTGKVGRHEDALLAHRKVLRAREVLAAEPNCGDDVKADVGRSLVAIGLLLASAGKINEAEAAYHEVERQLAGPPRDPPPNPAVRAALSFSRSQLGWLLMYNGRADEALALFRQARADQEALAAFAGASDASRSELTITINGLGRVLLATGKAAEAEREFRAALAIRQKIADEHPSVSSSWSNLASSHANLSLASSLMDKTTEAVAELRTALAIYQKLVDSNPGVTEFHVGVANMHNNLSQQLGKAGKDSEAEDERLAAMAIWQKLVKDNPAVTQFRETLAICHHGHGSQLANAGKAAEAEAEYRAALEIAQELANSNPTDTDIHRELSDIQSDLGLLLANAGKVAEAEVYYRMALAVEQKLADDNPTVSEFQSGISSVHNNVGILLLAVGKPLEAEVEYRMAAKILQKLANDYPAIPEYPTNLANVEVGLAGINLALGRVALARAAADDAVQRVEAVLKDDPKSVWKLGVLGEALLRRGQAHLAGGDRAGAAADWRRTLATYEAMPPRPPEMLFVEASCHAMLASVAGQAGSGIPLGERPTEAGRAIEILRRAAATGFRDVRRYRTESALEPLRDRDDFRLLMMDLAMPDSPLAR